MSSVTSFVRWIKFGNGRWWLIAACVLWMLNLFSTTQVEGIRGIVLEVAGPLAGIALIGTVVGLLTFSSDPNSHTTTYCCAAFCVLYAVLYSMTPTQEQPVEPRCYLGAKGETKCD